MKIDITFRHIFALKCHKMRIVTISIVLNFVFIYNKSRTYVCVSEVYNMNENKKQLLELIETLSDSQILFILTFLNRILGRS